MNSLKFVFLAAATLLASSAHAEIAVCVDHEVLTQDFVNAFNTQYIPTLPAEMVKAVGGAGGKDPSATISPIQISVIGSGQADHRIQFFIPEVKYSSRFLDTPLWPGTRVGIKGSVTIEAGLGFTADGKNIRLKQSAVKTNLHVDLGGTLGHLIAQLLSALMNAFAVQGRVSRQLQAKLDDVKVMPTFFNSKISKDGKTTEVRLTLKAIDIGAKQFCVRGDL